MKKYLILICLIMLAWSSSPTATRAQAPTPLPASGEVTGTIVNQNQGTIVTEILEVMLHIWDEQYVELGMLHAQSQPDGTFQFSEVPLEPGRLYGVMATYKDVLYYSNTVPAVDGSNQLELDVPVFETTTDLSAVQIDQMHILFNFATDGLETTEIYLLSNLGQRTVKDAVTLQDGQAAALRFPLPTDADFIFFQPNEQNRFIKFPSGFADTAPVRPGEQIEQHTVNYLVPLTQVQTYTYTAPLNIKSLNFLLPQEDGVSLAGDGLTGPQQRTLASGVSYKVYSYSDIASGQTIKVTFSGKPVSGSQPQSHNQALPLALGGGLLGLVMAGVGIWWWLKPGDVADDEKGMDGYPEESTFNDLIAQIARLDEAFERKELEEGKYHQERKLLREQAKSILDQEEYSRHDSLSNGF